MNPGHWPGPAGYPHDGLSEPCPSLERNGALAPRAEGRGKARERPTNAPVGLDQLRRLEHLRGLLPSQRVDQPPKLLIFSRSRFTSGLADEAATRPDVELVGIDRLYHGA